MIKNLSKKAYPFGAQMLLVYRLSVLLDSGIELSEAFSIVANMEGSKGRKRILAAISSDIKQGISFSRSISMRKLSFDRTLTSMISSGETSGLLSVSLKRAYDLMERRSEMKKKLLGALVYPGFISLATIGMTVFLVMYIFPKILPLLSSLNIPLPFLTRAVRTTYIFLSHYWMWVGLTVLLSGVTFVILYKNKKFFRKLCQDTLVKTPLFGEALKKYIISNNFSSMSTLMDSGQSLDKVLLYSSATAFESYCDAWDVCQKKITKGVSFAECLKSVPTFFPTLVPDIVSLGERTGNLPTMMGHIAHIYESEINMLVKQLSNILEPILMIFMGIVVGSIALSIILPIYEITNHLGH